MRYQQLAAIVVVLAIVFMVIDSSQFLRNYFMQIGDSIKFKILDTKDGIIVVYDKYINQAKKIEEYKEKIKKYGELELELLNIRKELDSLSLFDTQQTHYRDSRFLPARAYSYVGMGDYNRVWIDFDVSKYEEGRFFGIVQDNKALGIAIVQEGRLVGLLNGEKQSSYSVFIGDEKVPAIIHCNDLSLEKLIADYIPLWKNINIGDQVFTSGLDGIFIEGILVGEVVAIKQDYGYITAEVKPYARNFDLDYVWLVDTKTPLQALPPQKPPF